MYLYSYITVGPVWVRYVWKGLLPRSNPTEDERRLHEARQRHRYAVQCHRCWCHGIRWNGVKIGNWPCKRNNFFLIFVVGKFDGYNVGNMKMHLQCTSIYSYHKCNVNSEIYDYWYQQWVSCLQWVTTMSGIFVLNTIPRSSRGKHRWSRVHVNVIHRIWCSLV